MTSFCALGSKSISKLLCVTSCGQDNLLQGSSGHCQNGYTVVCTHSTSYQPLLAGVMQWFSFEPLKLLPRLLVLKRNACRAAGGVPVHGGCRAQRGRAHAAALWCQQQHAAAHTGRIACAPQPLLPRRHGHRRSGHHHAAGDAAVLGCVSCHPLRCHPLYQ